MTAPPGTIAKAFAALLLAAAAGCASDVGPRADGDFELTGFSWRLADFTALDGWPVDDPQANIPVFLRSCERISSLPEGAPMIAAPEGPARTLAGAAGDWRKACSQARALDAKSYPDEAARRKAARAFFEEAFRPVQFFNVLTPRPGSDAEGLPAWVREIGLFTAYFEPTYEASPVKTPEFSAPVYGRPGDLISVDLGRFRPELAGTRIAGRVNGANLDPYPDHAAINRGDIGEAEILAYMRPTDLLFLQIQGSGRLVLDGGEMRVGYDGGNGRAYTAIGRVLVERGELPLEKVSMQTIMAWLAAASEPEARALREANKSFVFFKILDDLPDPALGPIGSAGVQLTPLASLAVDPRYAPFGAPVFISIAGDEEGREPFRRLMIAQDSGGAIKGAVRGDIFIGSGARAGEIAGEFNRRGEMFLLIPAGVAARLADAPSS